MGTDVFHECEVKYRLDTAAQRQAAEQKASAIGFAYEGRQLETDFLPDTKDFLCRKHGLLLRFRRIISQNKKDILLTLKIKGTSTEFQEHYELEYTFSNIKTEIFNHINEKLQEATDNTLPNNIHTYNAEHFTELVEHIKTIFPAHRILLDKKRTTYTRRDCHILLDTLPEGIGDYLEIEAPSQQKLNQVMDELSLDQKTIESFDYGDILKRHKHGKPEQEMRTGLFTNEETAL